MKIKSIITYHNQSSLLIKTDFLSIFSEALSAHVETILMDHPLCVVASSAGIVIFSKFSWMCFEEVWHISEAIKVVNQVLLGRCCFFVFSFNINNNNKIQAMLF